MGNSTTKNHGKQFEKIIGDSFRKVPNVSVDRIPDQTMQYKDRTNVSDFIVFKKPTQYYVECKSIRGNRLPFAKITQLDALFEKSKIDGVKAGIICWWIDKDITRWIPIQPLQALRNNGAKSVRFDEGIEGSKEIKGTKKKIYFSYEMDSFFG